jgi:parallel beta-helix repeat protein
VGKSVGDDYGSIQAAVNAASPGDVINVNAGVYVENVVVNKSVSLFGENKETTVVDGNGTGTVIFVEASDVTVCNFTLRNSGSSSIIPFSGIKLNSSENCVISDNVIEDNQYGVWFDYSNNNTFVGNVVQHSVDPDGNRYGVRLYQSEDNNITRNEIVDNKYGVYVYSGSDDNIVRHNNASDNSFGIYVALSEGNVVEGNTVVDSAIFGITMRQAGGNSVFHNNFVNDWQVDVSDAFVNVWDDGYPSGGNYWSDYSGVDEFCGTGQNVSGGDGLGDSAFESDANNTDRYPLMGFFGVFDVVWNGSSYSVETVCNSTITGLSFTRLESFVGISLNVSGVDGTGGFCRVSVPDAFFEGLGQEAYAVVVNGNSVFVRELGSYDGHVVLYFAYVNGPFVSEFAWVCLVFSFLFLALCILVERSVFGKTERRG